jgi:probable phosphoglycerate mutase
MSGIILIRPGCTDFDEQHRIQGELDLPLNNRGRAQLCRLVERLRSFPIEQILAAPGEPALSTAETLGAEIGVPVKEVEGLRNLNQGLWQGLTIEEVRRKYPKVAKQWQESPETVCPPEGETVDEALERVQKVLRKARKRDGDVALVVCEPLATLISCVVQGSKLELPESITGSENNCKFEILTPDGRVIESCTGEPEASTVQSAKGAHS